MRFTHVMPTSTPLIAVQDLIMQEHSVPSPFGLKLFLGPTTAEENLLKSDDYGLSLEQLSINGGARNDHVEQAGSLAASSARSVQPHGSPSALAI